MTSDSSHRGSIRFYRGRQWNRSGFKFVYSFCEFRIFQSRRATTPRKRAPSSARSRACKRFAARTPPRRSSQKPVTKQPAETTSNSSSWHADSWGQACKIGEWRRKGDPRRLRSLTSALVLPLHHGQLLDALFRLACNRPHDFTIGAIGGLRFKRRDNVITQHIDARFIRPAAQVPIQQNLPVRWASSRFFSPTYKPMAVVSSG